MFQERTTGIVDIRRTTSAPCPTRHRPWADLSWACQRLVGGPSPSRSKASPTTSGYGSVTSEVTRGLGNCDFMGEPLRDLANAFAVAVTGRLRPSAICRPPSPSSTCSLVSRRPTETRCSCRVPAMLQLGSLEGAAAVSQGAAAAIRCGTSIRVNVDPSGARLLGTDAPTSRPYPVWP